MNYQGMALENQIKVKVKTTLGITKDTITLDVIDVLTDNGKMYQLDALEKEFTDNKSMLSANSEKRLTRMFKNIHTLSQNLSRWDKMDENEQFEYVKVFTSVRVYLLQK
ncbi:hypothetical protein [Fusibacter sp. JL216-2]|uniref:hypothetical protein n=1 Tax=Fusibacter sp. JL216-2 TaxID=3071453 RepID=UPI003D325C99